jgi:tetratricopeptide (TPR) repeat protein
LSQQYIAYLQEKLKKNPRDTQALIHFGVLSWEPFHKYETAVESLKKALEYDPMNVDAHFWLANCYYQDRCEYEKSEEMALKALAIDPTRADCLCLLGIINWDYHENLQMAIHYLEKAVRYAPDWPMIRHLLATLFLRSKDIKSAEFHVEKALELSKVIPIKPRNGVEKYYENVITGRSWVNIKEEFQALIERIQKSKASLGYE